MAINRVTLICRSVDIAVFARTRFNHFAHQQQHLSVEIPSTPPPVRPVIQHFSSRQRAVAAVSQQTSIVERRRSEKWQTYRAIADRSPTLVNDAASASQPQRQADLRHHRVAPSLAGYRCHRTQHKRRCEGSGTVSLPLQVPEQRGDNFIFSKRLRGPGLLQLVAIQYCGRFDASRHAT